jgi:hypothetical protein
VRCVNEFEHSSHIYRSDSKIFSHFFEQTNQKTLCVNRRSIPTGSLVVRSVPTLVSTCCQTADTPLAESPRDRFSLKADR